MTDIIPTVTIPVQTHSSLETFHTCPRQYEAKHVLRSVKFQPTYESRWGDDTHNALENFLNSRGADRIPDVTNMLTKQNMRDYEVFGRAILERADRKGGTVLAERKFAITHDHTSGAYFDSSNWVRGKIDLTVIYPHLRMAEVIDWKTGKRKNDPDQLMMYSASALVDYPNIDVVRAAYGWLREPVNKAIDKPFEFSRYGLDTIWASINSKYYNVVRAWQTNTFPPKPSGLCGWCDVTTCEFWKESPEKLRRQKLTEGL